MSKTCASCRFFRVFPESSVPNGECRIGRPVASGLLVHDKNWRPRHSPSVGLWPHVDSTDWCGEYEVMKRG